MMKEQEQRYKAALQKASEKIKALLEEVSTLKRREPVAVIGMGCRFPGGADTPEKFWQILANGVDTVRDIPGNRWNIREYYDTEPGTPGKMYIRQAAFLDDVETFDAEFFEISPKEVEALDPQQRMLLEVSWEALENAGLDPRTLRGSRTGVFLGMSSHDYLAAQLLSGAPEKIDPYSMTGIAFSTGCGRLSYFYDFQGPSLSIDTACSSSLVALNVAVRSLEQRESDLALVGGVNLLLLPETFISFSQLRALAPNGRCKTFSDAADGYGRGEGCGMVVLKRLSEAQRDGDRILALIRGTATNQDGKSNGLTAPNGLAQKKVIQTALSRAQLSPADVDYIEAHGTGTILGDPIEVQALGEVFQQRQDKLRIGAVKTNIGHLDAGAGIAGFIKLILSIQHKTLPPSLHLDTPNAHIPWHEIPVEVVTSLLPWHKKNTSRVAGVSAFGFSGTNAHVIVEEAPASEEMPNDKQQAASDKLLLLSAKSEEALRELAVKYATYIETHPDVELGDLCFSANTGRMHFNHRLSVLTESTDQLRARLTAFSTGEQAEALAYTEVEDANPLKISYQDVRQNFSEQQLLRHLAQQYVCGATIDWNGYDRHHRIGLPTYPFQRERYWIETPQQKASSAAQLNKACFYQVEWQETHPPPPSLKNRGGEKPPSLLKRRGLGDEFFLIFADRQGNGNALAKQLIEEGRQCLLVHAGEAFQREGDEWTINPSEADDFARLFQEYEAGSFQKIVHFWNLDTDISENVERPVMQQSLDLGCISLLHLVQTLSTTNETEESQENARPYPQLWVVTRGAMPIEGKSVSPWQSPAWGMSRVIFQEHPELRGGAIDLGAEEFENDSSLLAAQIRSDGDEDQIAFRDGKRYVARLVPWDRQPSIVNHQSTIQKDGSYLMTGGLGALGLKIAQWLVARGARHLVLIGRRTPSEEAQQLVAKLKSAGAEIACMQADVGSKDEMSGVLQNIAALMPPLRGIFHIAGMLGFEAIQNMSPEQFHQVLQAKVQGTWILHQLSRDIPLDLFVCFSSIASVWGSMKQSHYAAANHFLDIFAHYRHALDLPALSINWGPWIDGRMTSEEDLKWLGRMGINGIETDRMLSALDDLLKTEQAQVVVADMDWSIFKSLYEARGRRPFLDDIEGDRPDRQNGKPSEILGQLENASREARQGMLLSYLQQQVGQILGCKNDQVPELKKGFFSMGMGSLMAVELKNRLSEDFGHTFPATLAFEYPTITELAGYLAREVLKWADDDRLKGASIVKRQSLRLRSGQASIANQEPIAIIGMGCRFPGAENIETFWQLLRNGVNAITEVPPDRWDIDEFYDQDSNVPGKMHTRYGGFVSDVDLFDAGFFGLSPKEARTMDPQQRLLLEVSWEALEHAGLDPEGLNGSRTGVFTGISANDYSQMLMKAGELNTFWVTGNSLNAAAGRISYTFGLQGPSMVIDTACSSALVSVHLACRSLRHQECDMTLAGGVNLILSPEITLALCKAGIMSPDGQCKTFDAQADGYVRGEGCGVLVLKRLSDAMADENRILAVVRGSAVNQDGLSGGFTVPNGSAQQNLIRQALLDADLSPADVDYVEAHGTGTPLGDPIEIRALGTVLSEGRSPEQPLWIGSVKTNIGHLESAAGMASLIKLVLSLQNKEIPPHLNFTDPNPDIPWDAFPLKVPTSPTPWRNGQGKRIAGASGFGASGTNAHIILEEAPTVEPVLKDMRHGMHLFTLSAKTAESLTQLAECHERYIAEHPDTLIEDICFASNSGRSAFRHRVAIPATTSAELYEKLIAFRTGKEFKGIFSGELNGSEQGQASLPDLESLQAAEWPQLVEGLARLYARGERIDWNEFYKDYPHQWLDLPTYPFQRKRHWVEIRSEGSDQKAEGREQKAKKQPAVQNLPVEPRPAAASQGQGNGRLERIFGQQLQTMSETLSQVVAQQLQFIHSRGGVSEREPSRSFETLKVSEVIEAENKPSSSSETLEISENGLPVVFMFPGLGDHYVNMGKGLYQAEASFRECVDRCCEILQSECDLAVKELLFPPSAEKTTSLPSEGKPKIDLKKLLGRSKEPVDATTQKLNQTEFAHPTVFLIEYALAHFWMGRGIMPYAMIGQSLGEYAAACISGVLSLADALRAVVKRAQLIQQLPKGGMLAVPLPEEQLLPLLGDALSIAVTSTPSICAISGPQTEIQKLEKTLQEKNVVYRRLQVSHAFHSKMLEPIETEYIDFLKTMTLNAPGIPYISNLTGTWITEAQSTDPHYWLQHTCRTVRFAEGMSELLQGAKKLFLEVGPGQSLSSFVLQHHDSRGKLTDKTVLQSLRNVNDNQSDETFLLNTTGKLRLAGVNFT
ncbi:MAG: SDR family NAD(P)-dependent oxidoreductase [bacterium]|nr:SDR family NAD(P)-dependent oxidoreductase [bacterium]